MFSTLSTALCLEAIGLLPMFLGFWLQFKNGLWHVFFWNAYLCNFWEVVLQFRDIVWKIPWEVGHLTADETRPLKGQVIGHHR